MLMYGRVKCYSPQNISEALQRCGIFLNNSSLWGLVSKNLKTTGKKSNPPDSLTLDAVHTKMFSLAVKIWA